MVVGAVRVQDGEYTEREQRVTNTSAAQQLATTCGCPFDDRIGQHPRSRSRVVVLRCLDYRGWPLRKVRIVLQS